MAVSTVLLLIIENCIHNKRVIFVVVQLLRHVRLCDPMGWSTPSASTVSWSLLKFMSMSQLSNHLVPCHAVHLLPSVFPSIRLFPSEMVLQVRWLKYWSYSFSNSPSNESSGLVSFRIDWFDLLKIQVNKMILGLFHSGISSVQFSRSVMSNSLRPHELQHTRPPCPSPAPGVHSDSQPSSPWCHPAISSSVIPFSSCPQSLPASESFPMSQLFAWGGQSIGVSALASFLPKNTQDWSPLGWTGWISFRSMGLSRVFSNTTVQKHQFFRAQLSSQSNSHIHTWLLEKP